MISYEKRLNIEITPDGSSRYFNNNGSTGRDSQKNGKVRRIRFSSVDLLHVRDVRLSADRRVQDTIAWVKQIYTHIT